MTILTSHIISINQPNSVSTVSFISACTWKVEVLGVDLLKSILRYVYNLRFTFRCYASLQDLNGFTPATGNVTKNFKHHIRQSDQLDKIPINRLTGLFGWPGYEVKMDVESRYRKQEIADACWYVKEIKQATSIIYFFV